MVVVNNHIIVNFVDHFNNNYINLRNFNNLVVDSCHYINFNPSTSSFVILTISSFVNLTAAFIV